MKMLVEYDFTGDLLNNNGYINVYNENAMA